MGKCIGSVSGLEESHFSLKSCYSIFSPQQSTFNSLTPAWAARGKIKNYRDAISTEKCSSFLSGELESVKYVIFTLIRKKKREHGNPPQRGREAIAPWASDSPVWLQTDILKEKEGGKDAKCLSIKIFFVAAWKALWRNGKLGVESVWNCTLSCTMLTFKKVKWTEASSCEQRSLIENRSKFCIRVEN